MILSRIKIISGFHEISPLSISQGNDTGPCETLIMPLIYAKITSRTLNLSGERIGCGPGTISAVRT